MTLVSTIIADAFRQSNLVAVGVDPTPNEQTEALRYLNRIVKSVFGNEAGEPLIAFPIGSADISRPAGYPWYDTTPDNDWFVPKNIRLMCNLDQAIPDIYLHPEPDDGSRFAIHDILGVFETYPVTIHGNGRLISEGTSITLNTNGENSEWFYREDIANWQKYSPLISEDTFPFPEEFDDFFITMLAIRLNPSYGITLDQQSQVIFTRTRSQLRSRYNQVIPTQSELALFRMSKMAADRDQWGDSYWLYNPNAMFTKGWPW